MTNSSKHKVPKLLVFKLQNALKFFLYADEYSIYSRFFLYTLYALQHPTTMIPSIVPRVAVDSTIITIGFLCNILTIVTFCKGKRCPKKDHRAVVLNHCAACILMVIIAALWVLEGSGLYISAHGSEWQCHTIKILYNFAYYIIVYAVVAIVVDQTLMAKYNKAGVSHCKSTAILLSTTWLLAALSSFERLLRTSYKERETQTTSTITPIYNISTIHGAIKHPSDNLEDAVIDRYCLPDYDTVFGGSGEAAHWFSFSVSLISVLGIAIPSVAICIKAYRNRMDVHCKPDANKVCQRVKVHSIIGMQI